jgi:apolipoprotein N-acyltransferase
MVLALQSPDYWWLGWVTLLPLLLAIRVLPPWRALIAGSFWGGCFYLLSLLGGEAPFDSSLRSFALLTLIPGLYAGLGSVITRRVGFSPLLLGLGWVGVEFALQPLALHNGLLAGTQGDGLVVRVVGNLAGYALVAFLVAYVNAALLSVLGEVCIRVPSLRLAGGSSGSEVRRFYPFELPSNVLNFIRPSRPRGPPAGIVA